MTKVPDAKASKEEEDEEFTIPLSDMESDAPAPEANTKCQHFFGYLNKRPKENPFPEECLTCVRMVDCLLH
jgi:hypothetical protein